MLDAAFLPDVLSSDIHSLSVNGPAFDILSIMSKFLCLAVGLNDLIRSATASTAVAMHRTEIPITMVKHGGGPTLGTYSGFRVHPVVDVLKLTIDAGACAPLDRAR
jgi:dihydroorotase